MNNITANVKMIAMNIRPPFPDDGTARFTCKGDKLEDLLWCEMWKCNIFLFNNNQEFFFTCSAIVTC
jgi:hypothetical protein